MHTDNHDGLTEIAESLRGLRDAVCERAAPYQTPGNGRVGNLTEAAIFIGEGIDKLANAVQSLADAAHAIAEAQTEGE